jgi:hypothetical protein
MPSTNETNLERVFSDLAYSSLRDQAQALLDYLVGFQMLKQEDDGSRAVGIFGFEIDDQYYYAPVFFLNGEIRGLDSIYSVESDRFYPLTEDWTNELINRRSQSLGESDTRSPAARGVRFPNYTRLKIVPGGSSSSNIKVGAEDLIVRMTGDGAAIPSLSLPEALKVAGLSSWFKTAMDNNPRLQDAVTAFYSLMDFSDDEAPAVKTAAETEEPVVVISTITDAGTERLNDSQREELLAGGTVVIDDRPEVDKSMVFSNEPKVVLENPVGGGLYDVLWADGEVEPAVIAPDGSNTLNVVVYRPDNKKHCIVSRRSVFVVRKYTDLEFRNWLKDNTAEADSVRPGTSGFFISDKGEGTAGFCIDDVSTGLDDITRYTTHDKYYMNADGFCGGLGGGNFWTDRNRGNNGDPLTNAYKNIQSPNRVQGRPEEPNTFVEQILVVKLGGTAPRYDKKTLVVNGNHFRFIELNRFTEKAEDGPAPADMFTSESYKKDRKDLILKTIDFGTYNTLREALYKYAEALEVWSDGPEVIVRTKTASAKGMSKVAALRHLILDQGMGEVDARMILSDLQKTASTYYVRKSYTKVAAQLLDLPQVNDSSDGGFMSAYHKQEVPFAATQVASPAYNRDYYRYFSPFGSGGQADGDDSSSATFSVMEDAAKTGQKDVFDAAALASLIQSYRPTELVDRFLPTLVAGMDRLGRMLFLIYWHYEDFAERYGEQDIQEFIDNIRTVFEQMGDVIIFAKKKSLAGDPEHYGLGAMPTVGG